jgi:pimeloyl-ACP methyl ester carboxylesterase
MPSEFVITRPGIELRGLDFGGGGLTFLLLHGLAGYAGEWRDTAVWLTARGRVVALNARGCGGSPKFPADVSRSAHIDDAVLAIDVRALASPMVVIGQSLGGQLAFLLADRRPTWCVPSWSPTPPRATLTRSWSMPPSRPSSDGWNRGRFGSRRGRRRSSSSAVPHFAPRRGRPGLSSAMTGCGRGSTLA